MTNKCWMLGPEWDISVSPSKAVEEETDRMQELEGEGSTEILSSEYAMVGVLMKSL